MEPAFIIRHFAGKVKYQIKVGDRFDGCKEEFPCLSRSFLSECRKFSGNGLDQKGSQRYFGLFFGWWYWLEGNTHIYSERTKHRELSRELAAQRACFVQDFREKNMDYMRPDIVALLRSSDSAFVRELIGMDPVAVFRWAVLRAAIRAMAVFAQAGRERAQKTAGRARESAGRAGKIAGRAQETAGRAGKTAGRARETAGMARENCRYGSGSCR